MSSHDVIVVGGGHNGLAAAAYLVRAGLDVLVLERRPTVGGAASTDQVFGAGFDICACDHLMVRASGLIEDLGLEAHGLRYLDVDASFIGMNWDTDARPWFHFHDVDRTIDGLRLTHPHQVDAYRAYVEATIPVASTMLEIVNSRPGFGRITARVLARRGAGMAKLLRWNRRSALEVLRQFFDDEALITPALVAGPGVWGMSPDSPGTGLAALGYALKHLIPVGRPEGGSGMLPTAMSRLIESNGGTIRCDTRVTRIMVEGKRVRGVGTGSGEEWKAPVIVSAVDPAYPLIDWIADPPTGLVELRDAYDHQSDGYESKIDAVISRPPSFRSLSSDLLERLGVENHLHSTVQVAGRVNEIIRSSQLRKEGRVSEYPMFLTNVPSMLDPTRIVGENHIFGLEVLFTPYALAGGWSDTAEPERWLHKYQELVEPGFVDGIVDWRVLTPPDYERDFGMRRGHMPSFGGSPLSVLLGRNPELSRHRTPVTGLYLTGGATFPGAGVWGAPGRNAAKAVLATAGIPLD